jgi:hypothetical protein
VKADWPVEDGNDESKMTDRERDNDVFWRVALKNPRLKSLSANSRSMVALPAVIEVSFLFSVHFNDQQFRDLQKLNVKHNQLSTLPMEMAGLHKAFSSL